jgi:NAD(P)-dependent dehydrogenase (short-subunit alcohol dehydrogenase family)
VADISYEGRVAVITGAGAGLGRAYALLLASRGAKVVVNDLGGDRTGRGGDTKAADAVVGEIQAAGGTAVASYDTVSDPDGAGAIVARALDAFGQIDILVNNAGILRDVSFAKMPAEDWAAVRSVHLDGTVNVARAAWPHLREAGYGRVINTSSAAGLYGNFGQVNYSASKMGIVGFTRTLAIEGARKNIKANVIAPAAASRLTEDTLPPDLFARLQPEYVAGLVGYLASEACTDTGRIFSVGGGYVSRVGIFEGQGVAFDSIPTPEDIARHWEEISSLIGAVELASGQAAVEHVVARMNHAGAGRG